MSGRALSAPLSCPRCGLRQPADARFCPDCRLPLVLDPGPTEPPRADSERHVWARKIKPQLAEGDPVEVVRVRNQAEAEFIQGLLLEEGIPSLLRRSAGFDVPDFLAAGPRDVLVPVSGLATAREVLLQADILAPPGADGPASAVAPARLLVGILIALSLGALLVWLLTRLSS